MDFIAGLISALLSINISYTQRLICNCISALYMAITIFETLIRADILRDVNNNNLSFAFLIKSRILMRP